MDDEGTAYILSLETSTSVCSAALHDKGSMLVSQDYVLPKSHSCLLPGIIKEMLKWCHVEMRSLSAIAVSGGPGSYTGLRIGLSTAKGLCYALEIPLISVSSLDTLALFGKKIITGEKCLLSPMIDARRMEVYTKLLDRDLKEKWGSQALIIKNDMFNEYAAHTVYLIGDGAEKCKGFIDHENLVFMENEFPRASYMGEIAWGKFKNSHFEDTELYEPNYLKAFYSPSAKMKL